MKLRPLTRDEVREIDRLAIDEFGMPGICLMENAGRGTADLMQHLGVSGPVLICAGKGNNGGDGFVVARHLDFRGYDVRVLLFADPDTLHPDASTNYAVIERSGIPVESFSASVDELRIAAALSGASWIVDALLGTGLRGTVRAPFAEIINTINATGTSVLAIDLPSGLDCDSGRVLGTAIRAAHTATFVAPKRGFASAGADAYTGTVHVIDIGAPQRLLDRFAEDSAEPA